MSHLTPFDVDTLVVVGQASNVRLVHAVGFGLLLGLFSKSAGIAAVFGAAFLWIKYKNDTAAAWAGIASFAGGVWIANAWFGWPLITKSKVVMTSAAGFLTPATVSASEFSFIRLIGSIVLGLVGVIAMLCIVNWLSPEMFAEEKSETPK